MSKGHIAINVFSHSAQLRSVTTVSLDSIVSMQLKTAGEEFLISDVFKEKASSVQFASLFSVI